MPVVIRRGETLALLRTLVRLDSANPALSHGGAGEAEIAATIDRLLSDAGIETRLQEVAPGRWNVVGVLKGSGGGRNLIWNAHLDTVPFDGMADPLSARIENGRVYGRGALDAKGGLAAGLSAILALKRSGIGLKGDIVLVGAADEEHRSLGTEAVVRVVKGDGCVILEPTGLGACIAHGGFAWAELETVGVAAHGGHPKVGVDAIAKMGRVLTELEKLSRRLQRETALHSSLGGDAMSPSLHASFIEGGRDLSTYPDRCKVTVERRLIPGEGPGNLADELATIVQRLASRDRRFEARCRTIFAREPSQTEPGPLLEALDHACGSVLGRSPKRVTTMAWMDSAVMQAAGIPCVAFGPSGDGAHELVEWVDVQSVVDCAGVLAPMAVEFCG